MLTSITVELVSWCCTPKLTCCEYPARRRSSKNVTAVFGVCPTGTAPNESFSGRALDAAPTRRCADRTAQVMPLSGLFAGSIAKAERAALGTPASKGCANKDAESAAEHCFLRCPGLPGESDARSEVVPVAVVGRGAEAVHAHEFHHARRARHRIDRCGSKLFTRLLDIDHGRVGLPAHAEIEGQVAADRPVVLRRTRPGTSMTRSRTSV